MQIADAVDLVVLNCNNNGYLQSCIESIKENTDGSYNLIVVDQNSQDGSREWLLESNVASHLILNKKNVGIASGRNQGIQAGRYPWIAVIDSDVEIKDPDWLDKMWNYTIDRRVGYIEARVKINDWQEGQWKFAGMAFCLIRRQCFYEVGSFDRNFIIGGNLDWWVRLEWSWWKTAYCFDTDILHLCGKTMHGCLKNVYIELERRRDELLDLKYRPEFIEKTLAENHRRRLNKEAEISIELG